jgi:hypothetical protein
MAPRNLGNAPKNAPACTKSYGIAARLGNEQHVSTRARRQDGSSASALVSKSIQTAIGDLMAPEKNLRDDLGQIASQKGQR